jgi:sialidase-1
LLLVWNPVFETGTGHGGKRTPLVAAVSTNEGQTWSAPRTLEDRKDRQYAYTSLTFLGNRALLSYYVEDSSTGHISTRFRSLPLSWFYEPVPKN